MPLSNTFSSKDEQSARKKSSQTAQPIITPLSSETIRRVSTGNFDVSRTQVLALQRTIGNQAVQRLLVSSRQSTSTPTIQPKSTSNTIQRDTDDEDDTESYWKGSTESEDVDSWMDDDLDDDMYDDDDGLDDDSAFDWITDEDGNERIRQRPMGRAPVTRRSGHGPSNDPLEPTTRQVKRKVGFGKMLGWSTVLLGARIGDFVRSRFPNQPRHAWTNRAKAGYANTGVKARNKLYARNAKRDFKKYIGEEIVNEDPDNPIFFKDLKKSEQKRLLREAKKTNRKDEKEFKKRTKGYQKPQMVSF